ncbi:DUF1513 domain-containing protein [Eionea flava]
MTLQKKLKGYIGEITLDSTETIIAATSPKGHCVLFYHSTGQFMYHLDLEDVCGVIALSEPAHYCPTV